MAGVRNMGICPCPRCLIKKKEIPALGTSRDKKRRGKLRVNSHHLRTKVSIARNIIYGSGTRIYANAVNDILKEESLVPTTVGHFTICTTEYLTGFQNSFHTTFADFNLNVFSLFVVDLMHEYELGVFKDFLIHLLRILHSCGAETIAKFDRRYVSNPQSDEDSSRTYTPGSG